MLADHVLRLVLEYMLTMPCRILTGPQASVMENWLWNLLNVGVSLFGYHFAALSIDWKWWGRKRMQVESSIQLPLLSKALSLCSALRQPKIAFEPPQPHPHHFSLISKAMEPQYLTGAT